MRSFRVTQPSEAVVRTLPTAAVAAAGVAMVWDTHGSIAAADWLPYAVLAALVVVTVGAAGAATRPARVAILGGSALVGLAAWDAISVLWSPLPSLARDEALLVVFYALVFAGPLLTLAHSNERILPL